MSNLSKREKILLLILLATVVIVAYYYLLYQPIKSEQQNLRDQIAAVQTEYSSTLTKINKIEDLEKELNNLKIAREERLDTVVREAEEILAVIDFFARESSVTIRRFEKGEAENGYPFSFSLEGNYFELLSFLRMLDNWDYRLVVENLTADNIEAGGELIALNINMFYHQSDELKDFIEKAVG